MVCSSSFLIAVAICFFGSTLCANRKTAHEHHKLSNDIFDKEHILEDLKDTFNLEVDQASMDDDQIAFYYFNTHDFDKNGMLDGLEMLTAMNHVVDHAKPEEPSSTVKYDPENDGPVEEFYRLRHQRKWNEKFFQDSEFVDELLSKFDINRDGFLSYTEYIRASRASE
ncbi:Multiple coagulation factor deficiency protein 2 -like protein [Halotydeus destructor]|nr:Multiple coagulation factor deficiency protein 2 -like protein [Halotydeus destructor]